MTLANWKKKRDEEEQAKRLERQERLQANREQGGLQAMRQAEKERDAAVRARWERRISIYGSKGYQRQSQIGQAADI